MHWNSMSTFAAALYAVSAPVLEISLLNTLQIALVIVAVGAFALLFKPLLVGIARAMVLVVRPKLSREERLARQQVREARALQRTLGKMDGVSPSNAAELRALSTRA